MSTHRPLRLSYLNGLVCGVCGGIAERIGWRPRVVRALFVVLAVGTALLPAVLLYGVLYLFMPAPDFVKQPISK